MHDSAYVVTVATTQKVPVTVETKSRKSAFQIFGKLQHLSSNPVRLAINKSAPIV